MCHTACLTSSNDYVTGCNQYVSQDDPPVNVSRSWDLNVFFRRSATLQSYTICTALCRPRHEHTLLNVRYISRHEVVTFNHSAIFNVYAYVLELVVFVNLGGYSYSSLLFCKAIQYDMYRKMTQTMWCKLLFWEKWSWLVPLGNVGGWHFTDQTFWFISGIWSLAGRGPWILARKRSKIGFIYLGRALLYFVLFV